MVIFLSDQILIGRIPHGVVTNLLNFDIIVSKFEL